MPIVPVMTVPAGTVRNTNSPNPLISSEITIAAPITLTPEVFERRQPMLTLGFNKETSAQGHIAQLVG